MKHFLRYNILKLDYHFGLTILSEKSGLLIFKLMTLVTDKILFKE